MAYHNQSSRPYPRRGQQSRSYPARSKIHPSKYVQKAISTQANTVEYRPRMSFEQMGLNPVLVTNLKKQGITAPTPIQDQIIPLLLNNRDVIGLANTGTGKTLAFLLPMMHHLLSGKLKHLLVMAPTRELAVQIHQTFQQLTTSLRVSSALCIGGASMRIQKNDLRSNPTVVIGTPGRLKDFVQQRAINLAIFDAVVLDEVDRMLDIGFRKDIEELLSKLPRLHLTAFFSATIDQTSEMIMTTHSVDAVKIELTVNQANTHIDQDVIQVSSAMEKVNVLHSLLMDPDFSRVIVFGRTKHGINRLEYLLAQKGLSVCAIHGNKTQNARQRSLRLFTQGHVKTLLATDIAARGIDVENVSHVINFDEPQTYLDYIHRIGRTGRAGQTGKALTFVNSGR